MKKEEGRDNSVSDNREAARKLSGLLTELQQTKSGKRSLELVKMIEESIRELRPKPQDRKEELLQCIQDLLLDLKYATSASESLRIVAQLEELIAEFISIKLFP